MRICLVCGRSRVRSSRPATFLRGDWSWNHFYIHSLPSADSRKAVVSYCRKNVHDYIGGLPRKGVDRFTNPARNCIKRDAYGLIGLLDTEHNTVTRIFCCFVWFNVCRACNYKAAEHLYKWLWGQIEMCGIWFPDCLSLNTKIKVLLFE